MIKSAHENMSESSEFRFENSLKAAKYVPPIIVLHFLNLSLNARNAGTDFIASSHGTLASGPHLQRPPNTFCILISRIHYLVILISDFGTKWCNYYCFRERIFINLEIIESKWNHNFNLQNTFEENIILNNCSKTKII